MSIDNQVNTIKQALFSEMEKSKQIVFEGLLESPSYNRIPEDLFVNYFLPCFIGRNTSNPNWVMEWISIAGTPMASVIVFDKRTNQDLFTVPGILHTNSLFLAQGRGGMNDIFTRFNQINANLPSSGMSYLFNALSTKNNELLQNNNNDAIRNQWNQIFARYNLIPQQAQASANTTNNNLDDFLDF